MDVCKVVGMSCSAYSGRWLIGVRLGLRLLMYVFLALHCIPGSNLREAVDFSQSLEGRVLALHLTCLQACLLLACSCM